MAVLVRIAMFAATMLVAQTNICRADAIDGEWCSVDGMRMSIHGPDIVTPGGKRHQGNYSRHAFDYIVPAGEAGSGDVVNIILQGEWLAISRQGPLDSPRKQWRRCKEDIS
jgi:hypothetical protein